MTRSAHFLSPLLGGGPHRDLRCVNRSTGAVLATTLLPAFDRRSRNDGLLGRQGLPPDTALVLAPCQAVHTWFMRFPIDIVFVSKSGYVLKVKRSVGPWRMAARFGAFAVMEFAAAGASDIDAGHQLEIAPREPA